jgi:hypothetical protein
VTGLLWLLARRAATQRQLLATVLAVAVATSTLLGTCALLLTVVLDQGRSAALTRAPETDRTVEVVLSSIEREPEQMLARARAVLADALGPLSRPPTTWVQSGMQDLPRDPADDGRRLGYLAASDDLTRHARLVSGRWPAGTGGDGALEAVLPVAAATELGLRTGDRVTLQPPDSDVPPSTVVVVGTVEPDPADVDTWGEDALQGAGWTPAFALGGNVLVTAPAYGPFVVRPEALLGAGVGLNRVRLRTAVDLGPVAPADRAALRSRLADAGAELDTIVRQRNGGGRGGPYARLETPVPQLLDRVDGQASVISGAVLTVALVTTAVAVSTLGLAGRLLAGRRDGERRLLSARGAGRGQLAALGLVESLLVAGAGGLLAVLLALGVVRVLAGTALLTGAGLGAGTGPTTALVATVAGTAVLVALVLAGPGLRRDATGRPGRLRRRGALVRSGADLVLAGLAVAAWLELRDRQQAPQPGIDPVLVAVPVLVLLGGAVLALRLVPPAVRLAERAAGRSRRLVLPLVAWDVSRRPQATGAAFLVVLATAAATFAVAYSGTWTTSQQEQAAARVGADLTVPAPRRGPLTQGAAVAAATGGRPRPVAALPVALGSVLRLDAGTADAAVPRLLAVDTAAAGSLLRGRLPGDATWAGLTRDLVPPPAPGVPLAGGPVTLTVTGTASPGVLAVRPALLVADALGSRTTLTGDPVPLDGRPHPLVLTDPTGTPTPGAGLEAVGLALDVDLLDPTGIDPAVPTSTSLDVSARVEGAAAGVPLAWPTTSGQGQDSRVLPAALTTVASADGAAVLTSRVAVSLTDLLYADTRVVAAAAGTGGTAAPGTAPVPVLLSGAVARSAGLATGDVLPVQVRGATVQTRVAGVVPYLPSLPGSPGLLVDYTALGRALALTGDTGPLTSAWWVGGVPDPDTAVAELTAAGLPGAQTRAGLTAALRDGPLGVPLRVALLLLACGAVVLALAGAAVHSAAAQGGRVLEVARLHALGVPRRALGGVLLLQHGLVTTASVVVGAVLGASAAVQLAGRLVRSDSGTAPVPVARVQWPWPAEAGLLLVLLAGCAVVAVPVTLALVRRAGAAQLRLDDVS